MKTVFKAISLIISFIGIVFFLGPRPSFNAKLTFDKSKITDNLDEYLEKREADIPNILEGLEKEIIWANPKTKEQTDLAIIYIHGFSAAKPEIRPVPDIVAKACDANIYYMRLTGAGRDSAGLAESSVNAWHDDYAEAIAIGERIGKKILIIATSNGALITTYCLTYPELTKNVIGFISVSGAFELQKISNRMANMPWARTLIPLAIGKTITWEPTNENQRRWWVTEYSIYAAFPMTTLMNYVWHLDKSLIQTPALFFYSPKDEVVKPEAILKTAENWGGKTKVIKIEETADPRNHILAGDIMSPDNTDIVSRAMIKWIEEL